MRDYKKSDEMIEDLKLFLESKPLNNFTKIPYENINHPAVLLKSYESAPEAILRARNNGWMKIWTMIKINGEWIEYQDFFSKLKNLLIEESKVKK